MDILQIQSKLLKGVAERIAKSTIKKKLGCEAEVDLNTLNVQYDDDTAHVRIDLEVYMSQEELKKLLNKLGL